MTLEKPGRGWKLPAVIGGVAVALVLTLWLTTTLTTSPGDERTGGEPTLSASPRPGAGAGADAPVPTMWGTSNYREKGESTAGALARRLQAYGKPDATRVFHGGLPAGWDELNSTYGDTSLVVSFKAPPREVLAGEHDASLTRWFADAPTGRTTLWTYWHEPEDDTSAGKFTASDYRAAFRHVAQLADRAGNERLQATTIFMCWSLEKQSGRTWSDWYPGNDVVDVVGWDCYQPEHSGQYSDPEQLFGKAVAVAKQLGKPVGIGEWGAVRTNGDMRQRAQWIRDVAAYLDDAGAAYALYYDAIGPGGNDYRLLDEHARAAWRAVMDAH